MARIPRMVISGEQAVYHAWGDESSAKIKLTAMKKEKNLKNSILISAEQHLNNWWNQDPGLEKRWKNIKNGKMD